ncbi:hydrolase [uncultured Nitrosomonas sp.]|uniref:hydrolase n=1 Tax=uncultured Nitrosomonas sp. TaxID=156424 RepID=UPI0025E13651|nr:hydrolase [uncultured Nitrosomonas sp.]
MLKKTTIPLCTKHYKAPSWLPGGNIQTLYPYFIKPAPLFAYRRERWELDDGDFVDVDWTDGSAGSPLVIFFHGLEGGSSSHYILSMINSLKSHGWHSAVIHFRGCSGMPNRLSRAYHAGDSTEIDWMMRRILHQTQATNSMRPVYVMGVSLGGNALLKWLGEQGERARELVTGAATVSVPLDLTAAGSALDKGFNQVYTRHFLDTLKNKAFDKLEQFPDLFDAKALKKCASIYDFDNLVTAPLHGFRDTDDYWQQSSSKQWLRHIRVPTLVINARNDPFMPATVLPDQSEVSSAVTLEFPEQGGHAGFMQGPFPGKLDWLPNKILSFYYYQCQHHFSEETSDESVIYISG